MKWNSYDSMVKPLADYMRIKAPAPMASRLIVEELRRRVGNQRAATNVIADLLGEGRWASAQRPYYDMYPSVTEGFIKLDLDKVECQSIKLPLPDLLLRFAVGQEPHSGRIKTILASETSMKDRGGILIRIQEGEKDNKNPQISLPISTSCGLTLQPGVSILHQLQYGRSNPYCNDIVDDTLVEVAWKLVIAVCLLADNPDLIEQEPLDADRQKWEATHDMSLIEKAGRRGKRAWAVGKHITVAPGFRRPHFAIRWTGKGGTIPQLKPIRGCLVQRKIITQVPTGRLG